MQRKKVFAVLTAVVLSVAIPAVAMAQTTAIQARDTALQVTQGGVVVGLNQISEAGQAMHHVVIDNNVRFNVFVAVASGDVVRVTTSQIPGNPQAVTGATSGQSGWQNSPSPPPRSSPRR
ncbi:MAG: hypothetical protein FWG66_04445 [Spirochaetes bacterium]|nr:hypothetical protein [Spirochaetota bacterium]